MLKLSIAPPPARRVEFGGGAYAMVRPATKIDLERQRDHAAKMALGLATTDDAVRLFQTLAGLDVSAGITAEDMAAAAHTVTLVFLSAACITEISGVAIGDDELAAPLKPDQTALLCRDVTIANLLEEAIFARVAVVSAEGNGSPPSPGGVPRAADPTATDAGQPESPAPTGSPAGMAGSVPSATIIH